MSERNERLLICMKNQTILLKCVNNVKDNNAVHSSYLMTYFFLEEFSTEWSLTFVLRDRSHIHVEFVHLHMQT